MNVEITPYNDQKLIELCIAGQEMGYSKLYHKYVKQVYNTVIRLVIDEVEAEDLTQEIFISLFDDMNKVKDVQFLGAWLKRVSINKSISYLRKKKIHASEIEEIQVADESEDEVFEKELKEAQISEIQTAIEELDVEVRTIVNLFLFEDLSHEEIGKLLGLNSTTVRSKYHRAKLKIFQRIKKVVLS